MDIYFNCAQPTYEQLELDGDWDLNETEDLLNEALEEESPERRRRPPPGSPAPRALVPLFRSPLTVPLFPGRSRRRSAREVASGRRPMPSTKRYLSPDVWRYTLLFFCDVSTLLRLHATCRQLRAMVGDPEFVTEWQDQAWFLKRRGCRCPRNTFYLDVSQFLEFAWDCLDITSSRTSEVALRSVGRCVSHELAKKVPLGVYLDPRKSPRCFLPGLMDIWYENWILPVPRMVSVPVESTQVRVPLGERSEFWLDHHPVPEAEDDEDGTPEQKRVAERLARGEGPLDANFQSLGPDMVTAYETDCAGCGRDPHDPMQDNADCLGYHAVRYARRRMYESAVGIQTYPLNLCLRRSDMTGRAYRRGTAFLETLFLPIHRSLIDQTVIFQNEGVQLLPHNGPIYFQPVRYTNEAGDFVPWALSTIAFLEGVYRHAWFDSCHHIIRRMGEFARDLAREVQADMPMFRMAERWNHLHRRVFLGEAAIPNWHAGGAFPEQQQQHPFVVPQDAHTQSLSSDRRSRQDQAALHLMYDPHYQSLNRIIGRMAEREHLYWDSQLGSPYPGHYPYLIELLTDEGRSFAGQRTESMLVQELRELMHVTDYITRFAMSIAPLTDPLTETRRFRCLSVYLGAGTSLVMFAPSFRRMPSWRPSEGHRTVANEIPRVNLQANHRFRRYLRFLNRRTLFHVPDPIYPPEAYVQEVNPRA